MALEEVEVPTLVPRMSPRERARAERMARVEADARELHPGDGITVEQFFYGAELYVVVWQEGVPHSVGYYLDVVDDMEADLTRPDRGPKGRQG